MFKCAFQRHEFIRNSGLFKTEKVEPPGMQLILKNLSDLLWRLFSLDFNQALHKQYDIWILSCSDPGSSTGPLFHICSALCSVRLSLGGLGRRRYWVPRAAWPHRSGFCSQSLRTPLINYGRFGGGPGPDRGSAAYYHRRAGRWPSG